MEGETYPAKGTGGMTGEGSAAPVSGFKALVGVFGSPRNTFEALAAKPRFLLPMVVVVLAHTLFSIVIFQSGAVRNDSIAKMEAQGKSPEVIEATEKFFESPAAPIVGAVSSVVVTAFVLLFTAALYLFVGNLMLGARLTFQHYLSVAAYSAVVGLVDLVVRSGLALQRGSLDIRLGIGNALGEDPGYFGRVLDTMTDPLILWAVAIAALGISVLAKKKFSFGVMTVLPAFLLTVGLSGFQG